MVAKSCITKRMVETPKIMGEITYQLVQDFAGPSTVSAPKTRLCRPTRVTRTFRRVASFSLTTLLKKRLEV